ncbi:MAG: hypothetical protein QG626_165 [Patescibacteria group bacterium]|nr:hypothetical protein [Patescibacteria group bacterium]
MSALRRPKQVTVHDHMQHGYTYVLTAPSGRNFRDDFRPQLTPREMLALGIFGGCYMTDCRKEFPKSWFTRAKLSPGKHDASINFYKVKASQPLAVWQDNGWINRRHDPRGWFQWYCRYYLGRRVPDEDDRQIKRWKAIARHVAQLKKNCRKGDLSCRPVQRQALLHWAYDSRQM